MSTMVIENADAVTHCTRCKTSLENFRGHRIDCFEKQGEKYVVIEVICPVCRQDEDMQSFIKGGVITTNLMIEASLAKLHLVEFNGDSLNRLVPWVRSSYERYREIWLRISTTTDKVHDKIREFEGQLWLPKLQQYWNKSKSRGHSGDNEFCHAMMWGSAGRVLITIQPPKVKQKKHFETLTAIFGDSADYCRGGIQGMNGTEEQLLALADNLINHFPELKTDDKVCYV